MTAKRFNYHYDGFGAYYLCDKEEGTYEEGIIGEIWADKSDMTDLVNLLNKLNDENEQLKSDKEHLMGCLIRFFGYDDEDIDYNLNRESNWEYGKQYYSMKEETKKELEE